MPEAAFEHDRGHVGLGVSGGVQHERDDTYLRGTAVDEAIEGVPGRWLGQLQETHLDRETGRRSRDEVGEAHDLGPAGS